MSRIWQTIDTAPQQTRMLVCRDDLAGWWADAVFRPSVGWCYADDRAGPECRLKYEPTHWKDAPRPFRGPQGRANKESGERKWGGISGRHARAHLFEKSAQGWTSVCGRVVSDQFADAGSQERCGSCVQVLGAEERQKQAEFSCIHCQETKARRLFKLDSATGKRGNVCYVCLRAAEKLRDPDVARKKAARKLKVGVKERRMYDLWNNIKNRCRNPNATLYARYGGRGIFLCERWHDYKKFLLDMGPRPEGYSIDRINNDGPYAPWNCRWATHKTQVRNSTVCKPIEFRGRMISIAEIAEEFGVNASSLRSRLKKGQDPEDAVSTLKKKAA